MGFLYSQRKQFHLLPPNRLAKRGGDKTYKHKPLYLIAKEEGEIKGVLPLFLMKSMHFGKKPVSVPFAPYGGVCADNGTVKKALIEEAKRITEECGADYHKSNLFAVNTMTNKGGMEANPHKEPCFDFHIHSKFSYDSLLSPKRIVRIAERRGLDGIAITDHNTIKGALEASKFNSTIYVIIGSEIKTEIGDIIGLFLNEEITSKRFDEVVDEIKSQDGIVVLPHPYKKNRDIPNELLKKVDLIETLNGRLSPELNYKARTLAKNRGMPIIGGSDAHISKSIGSVRTIFNCEKHAIHDVEDVKQLLLHGDAKVVGNESPRYVHYFSAAVGNVRKGNFLRLGKLFVKEFRMCLTRRYE